MKFPALVLLTVLIALGPHGARAERSRSAQEAPVSRSLNLKVPGKIEFVSWSVQGDSTYIQLSFPGAPNGQKLPEHARTQVWLLKVDGTAMAQVSKSPDSPPIAISNAGWAMPLVIYTFPASARTEAVAVVVKVDEEFFVERLTPAVR